MYKFYYMILHLVVFTTNVNIDKNQTMGNNKNPMSIYTKYIIILKRRSTNGGGTRRNCSIIFI